MRVRGSRTTLRSFACAGPQPRGIIKLCVCVTEVIWIFHYEIQAGNEMEPARQVRFQVGPPEIAGRRLNALRPLSASPPSYAPPPGSSVRY
jgi:hypothetical protein